MTAKILVPGWAEPIGWAFGSVDLRQIPDRTWSLLTLERVRYSHSAHLRLIEGMAPAWMFLGAKVQGHDMQWNDGPLILLKLDVPPLYAVPYEAKNVTLGVPSSESMTRENLNEVTLEMISFLFNRNHSC